MFPMTPAMPTKAVKTVTDNMFTVLYLENFECQLIMSVNTFLETLL